MQELRGRTAIVTGSGSGIGRATALALAGAGANVVVVDLDPDRASAVADEVTAAGAGAIAIQCDVSADGGLESVRDGALARFGRIDIVMSNVGVIASGLPEAIPLDEWRRIVEINLLSAVRANLVFVPLFLERGEGHLVYTASINPLYPYSFDRLPYSATKAAVIAMAEGLSLYLRPRGIGVTCLCPGPVRTNITEQVRTFGSQLPLRTPGLALLEPSDVAEQVLDAIRNDRFLVITHPEVKAILVRRAQDPDGFVLEQIERMAQ
jgi:NAD(P)-dependent dehydrogenase (short-subunit alcohol dehydrogenase family)